MWPADRPGGDRAGPRRTSPVRTGAACSASNAAWRRGAAGTTPVLLPGRVRRAGRVGRGRPWSARWPRRSGSPSRDVRYVASQPWPFPGSLMLGFHAVADPAEPITGRPGGDRRRPLVHPGRDRACLAGGAGRLRAADGRLDRALPGARLARRLGDGSASCVLTCTIVGFVSAVPSANRTVGTVWLPPLTLITNSAAASSRSMSTTVYSMPSRSNWRLEPVAVAAPGGRVHGDHVSFPPVPSAACQAMRKNVGPA